MKFLRIFLLVFPLLIFPTCFSGVLEAGDPENALPAAERMPEGIFLQKEEAASPAENNPRTIVSEESRISDDDARFHLARLLAGEEATEGEALVLFGKLLEKRPDDPEILAALADLALNAGHAAESRRLYLRIVEIDKTEARRLAHAERMTAWGDFYGAERIYREVLADHPGQRKTLLKLADLLFAMQRTAEAEEICRKMLLREPDARDVLLLMVRLKMMEKDYFEAEKRSRQVVAVNRENAEAKLLLAEILTARQRYGEAIALYREAETLGAMPAAALGLGRVFLKEGKPEEAGRAFSRALGAAPGDVEARFRASGPKKITDKKFIEELFRKEKSSRRLNRWAELYAAEGRMKEAIRIYEVILARDPGFFPAQTALAELLALDGRFEEAIALYEDLSNRFPATSKIQIGKARALSWAKRYREALDLYLELCRFNPRDPVPVMEMARTAVWGKWYEEAHAIYSKLLEPSVDLSFQKALQSATRGIRNERLSAALHNLEKGAERDFITEAYKRFQMDFERFSHTLSREDERFVEEILLDFFATWRIQREAALERKAKELVWDKRPRNAIPVYRKLIDFDPGNEEARFDLAQLYGGVGLGDREEEAYRELAAMDPLHALAARALNRREIRNRPAAFVTASGWEEKGRGDLAQIERFRTDLGLDVPVSGRHHLRFKLSDWTERPNRDGRSYRAFGPALGFESVFSSAVKGEAGWTLKNYRDGGLASRQTGYGSLRFNLRDAVVLGMGAERRDEIANLFALRQGVQSDSVWVSARSDLTRKLEVTGTARWLEYNDGNGGLHDSLALAYAFTDHPRVFKVILSGDYRDLREMNENLYRAGELVDIRHPYWTPERNKSGRITLEWRHDLAKEFYHGGERHDYDIKLSFGTDSEDNTSVQLDAEWHYEFHDRWAVGVRGMVHRSREWDAQALTGEISWRF